ncbi:hypothetical protein SAMN02745216_04385 [Desulfatibacillum alkenivorans DSM 16219]|jgi:hypothetical protein|uniref:Curli production assembly/transport component CsgG n=1 Tax=Desulfatibacillum alkenivorans DSM 16219 TaxID=1121393 RepID=A0A1M6WRK1_9BACT|nr:hypothetical protein [Desulfatibacillum alkenivorans]SHK96219.1 hypothetical protein SAMN02745216_04385 [Desulfatibacillum alkenivorans DSM 16219]
MTKFVRILTVLIIFPALALLGSGCSTVNFYTSSPQELAQELMGPPGKLKKQIIVAQFYNPSQAQDLDLTALVGDPLKIRLRDKCKRTFVQDSPRVEYLVTEHFGPITGVDRNLALMAEARAVGAGIVVTGSLWKVSLEEEKKGIYPFRESVKVIKVSLDLWVYDSLTGSKIEDARIFSSKQLKDGEDLETVEWKQEIFSDIVKQTEDKICDALSDLPWTGFVTTVDGKSVTIASGEEVGLRKGMLLWICANGDIVDGVKGEQFVVPGKRLARAKVVEVYAGSCRAELTEDADVSNAAWVSIRNRRDSINPL